MADAAEEEEMKSLIRTIGMASGIVLLAGVQHAGAQIIDTVDFTTTFPFTVGTATMPAGSYTIRADDDNPNVLLLSGAHAGVFFDTTNVPAVRPARTEVVFMRYGDAYVLKNVYMVGSDIGVEAVAAEGERHIAKKSAPASEQRIAATKKSPTAKTKQTAKKN